VREPGLVASDVDGTLLDPWEQVSERTARTVRRVAASDTPFVLVTGRPPRWLPEIVEGLGVAGITVCSNGAVVYDAAADRVVRSDGIDPLLLHDVRHELRRTLPGCLFAVERSTGRARDRVGEQFLAETGFWKVWPNSDIRVVAADELVGKEAVKMLVLHEHLTSEEMALAAEEVIGSQLQVTYSTGAGLLELSSPGVNKASGLASVAAEFEVEQADVIAFGDMPNDIPMLDWAGHGVAMRNAHADVLNVADEIAAPNGEDGVAQVLERWWT
jgi:Cof subfamily protein (haloacid dehalogenase superfamily)